MRVAIFDSGTGGLSIFSRFIETFPWVDTTYLGDALNFPYGTKDTKQLLRIIERIIAFFKSENYDYVLIACNTASIIYERYLKNRYDQFVFDVIQSTALEACSLSFNNRIGVIGTEYTIKSCIYEETIKRINPCCDVLSLECSDLVGMCEQTDQNEQIDAYIKNRFSIFKKEEIDTFILGCTHYNVLYHKLNQYFNYRVNIISSGYALVSTMRFNHDEQNKKGHYQIYTTGDKCDFKSKKDGLHANLEQIKVNFLNL
ncbi:glutamate racemase [Haloplasma contractile]|nr:glutamate racemase [Haloplasma contractile]